MERREQLAEARTDISRVRALAVEVTTELARARQRVADLLDAPSDGGPADPDHRAAADLRAAAEEVARMRYYRRFLDEVEAIEEEASSGAAPAAAPR
jgi:molecular chaperone HscB